MAAASPKRTRAPRTRRFKLRRYGRRHGSSGVIAYATGRDFVLVQFVSGEAYLYTHASAGREHIAAMKRHAVAGIGLSAYISRHTHALYTKKFRVSPDAAS